MTDSIQQEPPDEATIAAYLGNRLSAARAEAFEDYCLRNPEFAQRVELDSYLKLGFQRMGAPPVRPRLRYRRGVVLGIAASVLLAATCGLLLYPSGSGEMLAYRSTSALPPHLLSGARVGVTLIRLRGGAPVYRIVPPRKADLLFVRIAPDSPPGSAGYAMTVAVDSAASRSITLDQLRIDAEGYVEGYLPLASLMGQTVNISLAPSPSSGTDTLSFQVEIGRPQSPASSAASGPRA